MPVGQIIYDVEDYAGSGGFVSSLPGQGTVFKTINSIDNENYNNEKVKITEEILRQFSLDDASAEGGRVTKLGIQAPPGTRFYINGDTNNTIMVGRTGIYELEDGPKVGKLQFVIPKEYTLDTYETQQRINNGLKKMREAKEEFDSNLLNIQFAGGSANGSDSQKTYYQKYDEYHEEYVKSYEEGRALYIQGLSGVYRATNSFQRLKNIIIDFVYNTVES